MAAVVLNLWKLCLVLVAGVVQVVSSENIVCLECNNEQCIQGVDKVTSLTTEYEAFMGIPFAKPPVGQLRFANPVHNDPWSGIYDATESKSDCIQRTDYLPLAAVTGSEDCLYLNVYRPKHAAGDLPVLVYIHGGAFQSGSSNPSLSGPDRMMNSRETILVTISYRLGALGFLSTGDSVAPGNFGLKDQAMAIKWVRKHIHKFGGDKHAITLFGEGAGAAATQLHMMSPLSRGNFARAIMLSGSSLALYARPDPDPLKTARLQVGALGQTPYDTLTSSEVITYLRNVPVEDLVGSFDTVKQMAGILNAVTIFRPVIEQHDNGHCFLHDSPLTLWATGNYEQIPMMVGYVPNEGIAFAPLAQELISNPTQWLALVAQGPSAITQALQVSPSALPSVMQRIFADVDLTSPVIEEILRVSYKLLTEVQFGYPLLKSITQHLEHADPLKAPLSIYLMNFTGPYSVGSLVVPGSSYPIVHTDDLQYVLNRPLLFPDFKFGKPGSLMATKMVQLFVEFARSGHALPSYLGTCTSVAHCRQMEISNTGCPINPVEIKLTDAIDSELLAFWDGVYNSPGTAELLVQTDGRRD